MSFIPDTIEKNLLNPALEIGEGIISAYSELCRNVADFAYEESGCIDTVHTVALGIMKGLPVLAGSMIAPTITFAACCISILVSEGNRRGKELFSIAMAGTSLACALRALGLAAGALFSSPALLPLTALRCAAWTVLSYSSAQSYIAAERDLHPLRCHSAY